MPFHHSLFCVLIVLYTAYLGFTTGIHIQSVKIPKYGVKGDNLTLSCDFHFLNSEKLLFLKWYKDENEFFRYVPSSHNHQILTFQQEGIQVDLSKSTPNTIVLQNITLRSSGIYKCEGMVETTFQTSTAKGYVFVIAPPLSRPLFTGIYPRIHVGEEIIGNCTLFRTKPAASLTVYANDIPLKQSELIEYPQTIHSDELEDSTLGFHFISQANHFTNGILSIKCTATIENLYWIRVVNVTDADYGTQLYFTNQQSQPSSSSWPSTIDKSLTVAISLSLSSLMITYSFSYHKCTFI